MRRIQIHLDEELDRAAAAEAARRGISKAGLIRDSLMKELGGTAALAGDPWEDMTGWLENGAVSDIDAAVYDEP